MRFVPSGFMTRNIGEPHGDFDARMKPFLSNSCSITPAASVSS